MTRSSTRVQPVAGTPGGRGHEPSVPSRVPGLIVLAAGLWLLVSWWLLGYSDTHRAVAVEVVAAVALLSLGSLRLLAWSVSRGVPVLVMCTGLGLLIAPVVLRYGYLDRVVPAYVNGFAVGLVVLAAGFWLSRQGPHEDSQI